MQNKAYSQASHADVLLFTKTAGFRHKVIPTGISVIKGLGDRAGFTVTATEDASIFTEKGLSKFKAIIFMNTSGDLLNDQQKIAFQKYLRAGGGFVAIHQGVTTLQKWKWYTKMVGGFKYDSHPEVQSGVLHIENHCHPSTILLPATWEVTDEFYSFTHNPRKNVHVLLTLDESTYKGGTMGDDHPYAWYRKFESGRVWCTTLGHTKAMFKSKNYQEHLIGGIRWAAGLTRSCNCSK